MPPPPQFSLAVPTLIVDEAAAARDKRVVLVQAVTVEATPTGLGGGHADGVHGDDGHDDGCKNANQGGDTDCERGDSDKGFFTPPYSNPFPCVAESLRRC